MNVATHATLALFALSLAAAPALADEKALLERVERMEETIRAQQERIAQLERDSDVDADAAAPAPAPSPAAALRDRLRVNAFGGWGYGDSNHGNDYGEGAADHGSYENFEGGLTFAFDVSESIRLGAQVFGSHEGFELEWLFAEWRYSDGLRVRAGRSKQPFGLYSEVLDIGTARAFFNLPQSVYDMPELGADVYEGLGLTGFVASGDWGLNYDLYAGSLHVPVHRGAPLEFLETGLPAGHDDEDEEVEDVVGGRVQLETPLEGLLVGALAYRGKNHDGGLYRVGGQARFERGPFDLKTEYIHGDGDHLSSDSAYVESTVRLGERFQLAGRVDWAELDSGVVGAPSDLEEHLEFAAGLNYWLDPGWVWRLSYHHILGNLFSAPAEIDDLADVLAVDDETSVVLVGTQFSF